MSATETTLTTAQRNREAKKRLVSIFGKDNVKVRGSRGTAYGWLNVDITIPVPETCYGEQFHRDSYYGSCLECRETHRDAREKAEKALDGLSFGTWYVDDGYGTQSSKLTINVRFNRPSDYPNPFTKTN